MKLVAVGSREQVLTEDPMFVRWGDGAPATVNDYHHHQGATHRIFVHADRFERRMFRETIADMAFDSEYQHWIVTVDGVACAR